METHAYIFDYGATIDTRGEHWSKVIWRIYKKEGLPVTWEHFWEAYVFAERQLGKGYIILPTDTFRVTLQKKLCLQIQKLEEGDTLKGFLLKKGMNEQELIRRLTESIYAETLTVTNESREVLQRLQNANNGTLPMVLVSNFYGNIRTVLEEFHLDSFFDDVIESAEVGIRKPDPAIWALGIKSLQRILPGLKAEGITVVGDSEEKDIIPAASLGCHTIKVNKGLKHIFLNEKNRHITGRR